MTRNNRIVNIRYTVDGLHFDAAVDCDWQLHIYKHGRFEFEENDPDVTPIELYCIDHKDWDIKMIYWQKKGANNPQHEAKYTPLVHTICDIDFIISETRKWIKEQQKAQDDECNI